MEKDGVRNVFGDRQSFPSFLIVFCLACSFYVIFSHMTSRLSSIPGPLLAKFSSIWKFYHILKGDWHEEIVKQHHQYGPYVRIAPNEVSTVSPNAIRTIYSHSGNSWAKTAWYETWWAHPKYHPTFAETDVMKHRNQRRRVSKFYSMSYVLGLESYLDALIERFLEQLYAMENQAVNMTKWTQLLTFDIVGELGFGQALGCVHTGQDVHQLGYWVFMLINIHASLGWSWLGAATTRFPIVRWVINNTLLRHVDTKLIAEPLPRFRQCLRQSMATGPSTERNDLVTQFRHMKNPDGSDLDPKEVAFEIGNIVIAGADTTAVSLRAVLYYIASNTRVYRKLQAEIDNNVKCGQLSRLVTFREAKELEYLPLVIKEALRLYPAVGYQLPRVVPKGGAHIDGHFFPESVVVSTNGWALHRNPDIFGTDCNEFRPERWIKDQSNSLLKGMEDCYGTFGFGSRTCLGKNMGLMSLYRLVPTLMQRFEMEICYPQKPWVITTAWFAYSNNFYLRLHSRGGT